MEADPTVVTRLRRTVAVVALLNFSWFWVEIGVALGIGSVALFADSVDFLEDTAINLLILLGLTLPLRWRSRLGKAMAVIILIPAAAALVQAAREFLDPSAPEPVPLLVTAGGAILVNGVCAFILGRYRESVGSMSRAAYLAARNDVVANLAIIAAGLVMLGWRSGWPDLVVGVGILLLNLHAAREVWQAATDEGLIDEALDGEFDDD